MANPVKLYGLSVIQQDSGDAWGLPNTVAVTEYIDTDTIKRVVADTTVTGANSRVDVIQNIPTYDHRVLYSDTAAADIAAALL